MKILIIILLLAAGIGIGMQTYFWGSEKTDLQANLYELGVKLDNLQKENNMLKAEIEYFSNPDNLEKEFRARFNYKKPGEEMIIVVP